MNKFKFRDKYLKYAELQITQVKKNIDFYETISKSEYNAIKDFIAEPNKILELGCGLGRFSVYLNWQLDYSPKFYLADFSELSEKVRYGWNPKDSVYNDLDFTSNFCKDNGLNNFEIINLRYNKISKLEKQDLICSFLSVGFHYPLEEYLGEFRLISDESTLFIFGARKGVYSKDKLLEYFKEINIVQNEEASIKEEILILRGLR